MKIGLEMKKNKASLKYVPMYVHVSKRNRLDHFKDFFFLMQGQILIWSVWSNNKKNASNASRFQ